MRKRRPFAAPLPAVLAIQLYAVCSARINPDGMAHNPGRSLAYVLAGGNSPDASCQQLTSFACLSIMKGEANRLGFRLNQIQWYRPPSVLFSAMKFPANPPWNLPGPAWVGTFSIDNPWICRPVRRAGSASFFLFSAGPGSHRCSPLVRFDYNRKQPACQYQIYKLLLENYFTEIS